MITNWDIISHSTSAAASRSFTLVIDGNENDARLIAKKLAGYVQEPVAAQPPFTYAFSLPADLDEDTLDKIRTAVREGTAQANKVSEFVPNGALGNPLFNSATPGDDAAPEETPAATSPQLDLNPEDSFLREEKESVPASADEVFQDTDPAPAQADAQGITVSDKDMLIKDMEDTLLGKTPLEDIFSAETKYDMFMDADNPSADKDSRKQPADSSAPDVANADEAFNIFNQKLKEQTNVMDLDDLNAITNNLPEKDNAATTPPAKQEDPLPAQLSVHSIQTGNDEGQEDEESSHGIPEEVALGNTVPPYGLTGKTPNGNDGLPDIAIRGGEPGVLENTFNLEATLSTEFFRNQYAKTLHTDSMPAAQITPVTTEQNTQPAETPTAAAPAQTPVPAAQTTAHAAADLAENTSRIPLTDATKTKTTLRRKSPAVNNAAASAPAPEQPADGKTTLRIRRKPAPKAPVPPAPRKPRLVITPKPVITPAAPPPMPPAAPGKTRLVLPNPIAPQPAPAAPVMPPAGPAEPTLAQPLNFAAEPPAQDMPAPTPNNEAAATSVQKAEKTKTIDYSIELPLSELKKHNWPLEVPLLPTYTLENFVLSVNRFAHATAISVMDNPGKMYNPLVFHGATGTGKTHFLNALAYGFSKKYGQENIFMTNGVRLSRGIQRYVMEGNIEKFEKFMDSVKVLLIDDIHLLAINEQNRAHISKLLNKFLKEQKQIVITSKYPPESLEKLENLIQFRLDSGWISELKSATGQAHFKIVKTMLLGNGVDLNDAQISQFFGGAHMTLSTIMRSIRRLKVLENLVFPNLDENDRSQADMFEKLLATTGEDPNSELLAKDPASITTISTVGNGEWGRLGFFYPANSSNSMNWMVYALEQRAKELGISGGFDIAVRSSYSTENIISSAFKIANLCDNKKLRGAVILGPALTVCEPSVRENFYDILTHMLEIMLIRCGIINAESLRLPSTYVKVISELLR